MFCMSRNDNKRGLSPVIATVLLISIAVILMIIIFIWARGFLEERMQKMNQNIENICPDIEFDAELTALNKVHIVNTGNIPLYGIEIRQKDEEAGGIVIKGVKAFDQVLMNGEDGEIILGSDIALVGGKSYMIFPVILGETSQYKKPYTCADDEFGKEAIAP